jgi:hypothetical protein
MCSIGGFSHFENEYRFLIVVFFYFLFLLFFFWNALL